MKTSKIWLAIAIIIGTIGISTSCDPEPQEYVEAVLDFNITLPEDWTFQKDYLLDPLVYRGFSPAEFPVDIIEGLVIFKLGPDYYTDLNDLFAQQAAYIELQPGFNLIWANDTTINGEPSKKLIHNITETIVLSSGTDDYTIVAEKYFFMHSLSSGDYGFIVNFSALDSTYARFKGPFQDIISSFTFK